MSDSGVHLRSHVIHRLEFQQLAQALQQRQQQELLRQEQELPPQAQELQQLVQAHRQQELELQLQVLLLLLLLQLFSLALFSQQPSWQELVCFHRQRLLF